METLFIEKLKKVDSIVERYDDVTGEIAGTARSESGVTSAEVMEQELAKVVAENRLLSIGIVGRVKAGKSSLLNALFFGGKQILPKAATPMTAALTIIRRILLSSNKNMNLLHNSTKKNGRRRRKKLAKMKKRKKFPTIRKK